MEQKDYYETLGVEEQADPDANKEDLPEACIQISS